MSYLELISFSKTVLNCCAKPHRVLASQDLATKLLQILMPATFNGKVCSKRTIYTLAMS